MPLFQVGLFKRGNLFVMRYGAQFFQFCFNGRFRPDEVVIKYVDGIVIRKFRECAVDGIPCPPFAIPPPFVHDGERFSDSTAIHGIFLSVNDADYSAHGYHIVLRDGGI